MDCAIEDFAYAGAAILVGGQYNLQESEDACQLSCQGITNCNNWTFFTEAVEGGNQGYCTLHYEVQGSLNEPGTISGPKFCEEP